MEYGKQDSHSLLSAMLIAQVKVRKLYNVELGQCYSTASLVNYVYRTHYLENNSTVPTLDAATDARILALHPAFFSGSCDYYKRYGTNLYYYDINSLYPAAITQTLPCYYLGHTIKPDLSNFFGYVYATITLDNGTGGIPFIPYRDASSPNIVYPEET